MPIQYIIGEWPFRDLNLKIKPPVFIPRPETEELVELVLKSIEPISKTDLKIADICCGSGAISLALLKANNKVTTYFGSFFIRSFEFFVKMQTPVWYLALPSNKIQSI